MAATETRTPEQVTREIEQEREQLATAVTHLRDELNVKTLARAHAGKLVVAGVVIVGVKVGVVLVRRRARARAVEQSFGREVVSFGGFSLWQHR